MSTTVNLTGRLTADPEMRYSAKGRPVARFTVVTSRRVKNQQAGRVVDADTSFWDCVAFGQLAENACESLGISGKDGCRAVRGDGQPAPALAQRGYRATACPGDSNGSQGAVLIQGCTGSAYVRPAARGCIASEDPRGDPEPAWSRRS